MKILHIHYVKYPTSKILCSRATNLKTGSDFKRCEKTSQCKSPNLWVSPSTNIKNTSRIPQVWWKTFKLLKIKLRYYANTQTTMCQISKKMTMMKDRVYCRCFPIRSLIQVIMKCLKHRLVHIYQKLLKAQECTIFYWPLISWHLIDWIKYKRLRNKGNL